MKITATISDVMDVLEKIEGGYKYMGAASTQICFPLKAGGELRFSCVDDDVDETPEEGPYYIDIYNGSIPAGVTGPAFPTGGETNVTCEHGSA